MSITKIGVFYDGGYFSKVVQYYRFQERKTTISLNGLHKFIVKKVAELTQQPQELCIVAEAHYFRNRFSTYDTAKRENQLYYDRLVDDSLMYANVIPHYSPIYTNTDRLRKADNGVDVSFALEAYEQTLHQNLDVVVLITGDGTFVPLVKRLNNLRATVLLLHWKLNFPAEGMAGGIRTSEALIQAANYNILMSEAMEQLHNETINNVFVQIDDDEVDILPRTNFRQEFIKMPAIESAEASQNIQTGSVVHIDNERGIGNLKSDIFTDLIFFRNRAEDFDSLERGDEVAFKIGQNRTENMAIDVCPIKSGMGQYSESIVPDESSFRLNF